MAYEELSYLSVGEFKRLPGVKRKLLTTMIEVFQPQFKRQGKRGEQNK